MQLEVGAVLEGKITGITNFGAFVTLPDGKSGLVHISEIANTYVNDIREHVTEGAVVKVRVIGFGDNGRINLSIKKASIEAQNPARGSTPQRTPPSSTFEDKLKQFMQDSDSKMSGIRQYSDRKSNSRRRRS